MQIEFAVTVFLLTQTPFCVSAEHSVVTTDAMLTSSDDSRRVYWLCLLQFKIIDSVASCPLNLGLITGMTDFDTSHIHFGLVFRDFSFY